MEPLLEFFIGILVGVIGGGVVITLFSIILAMISENIYEHRTRDAVRQHNRYVDKKFKEFIRLREEFFKFKKRLMRTVNR